MLHANVGNMSVCTFNTLDPAGTWTWGGLYDYQVPYVRPMWVKWARKWEDRVESEPVAPKQEIEIVVRSKQSLQTAA